MSKLTLPSGWSYMTIKELGGGSRNCVQTGPFGAQLHAEDYVEEGIPLILIRNITGTGLDMSNIPRITHRDAKRLDRYSLQKGDVVFSRVGRVGSCFLCREEHVGWIISGQTLRIRLQPEAIDTDYLMYALQEDESQKHISGASVGTTRTSINTEILGSLPVVVPKRSEQLKIAKILSTVDNLIEKTQTLIDKYQYIKQGMMHDLFTRGVDEHGQLRPNYEEAPHLYKESELGWIPKEWAVKKLGGLCDVTSSKRIYLSDYVENGIPFFRSKEIIEKANSKYVGSALYITDRKFKDIKEKYGVPVAGDILITSVGTLGISYLVKETDEFYFKDGNLIWFRSFCDDISPEIFNFILPQLISMQLDNLVIGTSQKAFTIEKLKKMFVTIPPQNEQEILLKNIKCLFSKMANDVEILHKFKAIKSGLMQDLLTGKVRVKVDA